MRKTGTLLVFVLLAVSACRAVAGPDEIAAMIGMSIDEVMARAYDPAYRVPPGFFVDDRADTPGSYTIHHLMDSSLSFEVCTDDYLEAFAWEEADNASRAVNGVLVGAVENDRYFEFVRDLEYDESIGNIDEPTSPGFARVFKCSFVDRSGVDRHVRDGFAGRLNARPVDEAAVASLTEYLWQFTFFWPAKASVLRSSSRDHGDRVDHTLTISLMTRRGQEQCDRVEIINWTFSANKGDGQLTKEFEPIYEFESQMRNGIPTQC